jgi:hypothetical protein
MRNRKVALSLAMLLTLLAHLDSQQVPDTTFRFANDQPAYAKGAGPRVCIDAAHHNLHTMNGRYRPFARLLELDGYRVRSNDLPFAAEALQDCDGLRTPGPSSPQRAARTRTMPPSAKVSCPRRPPQSLCYRPNGMATPNRIVALPVVSVGRQSLMLAGAHASWPMAPTMTPVRRPPSPIVTA